MDFKNNIKYLFAKFKLKESYSLVSSAEVYSPATGSMVVTETISPVTVMSLSIDEDNLPENCTSLDTCFSVLTSKVIDSSDKIRDSLGQDYTIKYLNQTSFKPIVYEVILNA